MLTPERPWGPSRLAFMVDELRDPDGGAERFFLDHLRDLADMSKLVDLWDVRLYDLRVTVCFSSGVARQRKNAMSYKISRCRSR